MRHGYLGLSNSSRKLLLCSGLLPLFAHGGVCMILIFIHKGVCMRTNIVIDDKLMMDALKASGLSTKKEVVEEGLKLLVLRSQQQEIRKLRGRIKWEGDLDQMRGGK
jgi:Arc/MetJ family transcription regulator